MSADLLLDPAVRSVLGEARQAFIAVSTRSGPHVTPELYAAADGRLWFASAAQTLKVKVLGKRSMASVLVRAGNRSVVVSGETECFDPLDPSDVARAVKQAPAVAKALAGYGLRNASDLAGFVVDAARGRAGRPPGRRTLLALAPDRVAALDGGRLVGAWGDWPGSPEVDPQPWEGDGIDAVVGWQAEGGPVAVPARWDPEKEVATVPPVFVSLAGLPESSPACVVADQYGAPGPAAKSGVLLRGTGERQDDRIRIDAERVTAWDGIESSTEPHR